MLTLASLSSYFQRIDALRWTPYLEDCVRMLAENKEQPTDSLLEQFVRLQLIVERAAHAPWHDGPANALVSLRAPVVFHLKALQAQLQDFKRDVPQDLRHHGTSISIYQQSYKMLIKALQKFCSYIFIVQNLLYTRLRSQRGLSFLTVQTSSD